MTWRVVNQSTRWFFLIKGMPKTCTASHKKKPNPISQGTGKADWQPIIGKKIKERDFLANDA